MPLSDSEGPQSHVILLVPGSPTPPEDLFPLARALADLGDVRVVEPPGYGETPAADGTMAARARHLLSVCRTLDADRVSVVGYSAGSYDALAAVAAGAEPDRIVFFGGTTGPAEEARDAYRQLAATIAGGGLSPEMMGRMLLAPRSLERPEVVERASTWLAATSTENLAAEVASFAEAPDLTSVAVELGERLRVVHAELDGAIPIAGARALASETGAPLTVLPGLGHAAMLEAPDAVAEALHQALVP